MKIIESPSNSGQTHFNIKTREAFNELVNIGVDANQKRLLSDWIKKYMREFNVCVSLSERLAHDNNYKEHLMTAAANQIAQQGLLSKDNFIIERLHPFNMLENRPHSWSFYEERYVMSLAVWNFDNNNGS